MRTIPLFMALAFFTLLPVAGASAASSLLIDLFKHECALFNQTHTGIYCGLDGSDMFLVKNRSLPEARDEERETKRDILLVEKRYMDAGGKSIAVIQKYGDPVRLYCAVSDYNLVCDSQPTPLAEYCKTASPEEWFCQRDKP